MMVILGLTVSVNVKGACNGVELVVHCTADSNMAAMGLRSSNLTRTVRVTCILVVWYPDFSTYSLYARVQK